MAADALAYRLRLVIPLWSFCLLALLASMPSIAGDLKKSQQFYDQARLRSQQGDPAGAIEDLTNALRENPRFADALMARSVLYCDQKKYITSLADSSAAILINPKAIYFAYRCDTYLRMGELAAAASDCNRAVDLDPLLARAYANRAAVRKAQGNAEGAETDLAKARELNPQTTVTESSKAPSLENGEYGSEAELKGLTKYYVMVGGNEVSIRNAIVEVIERKHPGLQLVERSEVDSQTMVLYFYGQRRGSDIVNLGEVLRYTSSQKRMIASFRPPTDRKLEDQGRAFAKDFLRIYHRMNPK